jgi:hypothetical protein
LQKKNDNKQAIHTLEDKTPKHNHSAFFIPAEGAAKRSRRECGCEPTAFKTCLFKKKPPNRVGGLILTAEGAAKRSRRECGCEPTAFENMLV